MINTTRVVVKNSSGDKVRGFKYSVVCDTCGNMVASGTSTSAEAAADKCRKDGIEITKKTNKVKCSTCQKNKMRKPSWARR